MPVLPRRLPLPAVAGRPARRRRAWATRAAIAGLSVLALLPPGVASAAPADGATPGPADSVFVEALTWTELHARVQGGATTLLVPVGGIEQSGPHIVLGKHDVRVHVLAGQIARQLGQTLVAPVLGHVPEGAIEPPTQHMRYPGTLSLPEPVFEGVLEAVARSYRQHGLRRIVFLGDHGGYQASLKRVAERLDRAWSRGAPGRPPVRVHALTDYYRASSAGFDAILRQQGHGPAQIGEHAGLADTALALAVDPALVRTEQLARTAPDAQGVRGDPRAATAALGRLGVQHIVDRSVAAIRALP